MLKRFLHFFCLISLFLSLLSNAIAQNPRITSVSIDTVFPQQIKISWLLGDARDSVTIFKCSYNCETNDGYNWDTGKKLSITETEWIDSAASSVFQNYYSIGWKEWWRLVPHNNMVLKTVPATDGCLNSISLSWNPYINMLDSLDYYNIFYRKIEIDTPSFTWYTSTEKTDFTIKFLENETIYEFAIQAVSKTDSIFAFSNIARETTKTVINEPVTVTISRVSVLSDNTAIEIDVKTDNFPDPQNFNKMYLLRGDEPNNPQNYVVIDSLLHNYSNKYFFTDPNVEPKSKLYYYQAIADNQCKANDTSVNIVTNILLTGHRVENERYKDSIVFYHYGVDLSETYVLLVNEKPFLDLYPLTILNNRCLIDVEKFMKDGHAMLYQIESGREWYSNTLAIEHEPIVHFPNAFYPNGVDVDKTFYPIISFSSEENYLFIIYNRWGQELYRSTKPPIPNEYNNMQGRWDGTFKGQDCPAGIYAYKLSYSHSNGKGKFSKSGSFMLVR